MEPNLDKTLLAFLLALYRLEPALTDDELYALDELGDTLGDWSPEEELTLITNIDEIASANPVLNQLYQEALTKLAPLELEELYQRLPSPNRVDELLGLAFTGRGYRPQGKPNQRTCELVNLSRLVMTRDRPDKSVKKIESLAEYWELPQAPIF
ncbi:hypothetical protein [Laspinema olomoucense]|uniref:Tellurite resistance protein TerB n=1 Tax=Laspinema olomoucense D3b TaxID=2953688 RepID=A0ABT2N6Z0_9CYAN|nr:hypothetical protein [Laspinema sp. D3b]MCT7978453.1 hypothetical protein [Laspinema sp. D3b]